MRKKEEEPVTNERKILREK